MSPQQPDQTSAPDRVQVRGARQNNLRGVDLDLPREAIVVFTGVSGSGKSSLAFGTLFAESQRRYLESVSPYARRLIDQAGAPDVDAVEGMPPAVALQQSRGGGQSSRSDVATVTTVSSLVRMLYSRAGKYPEGQELLLAECFSPNTPEGACPECHGIGQIYDVREQDMVPDDSLTIRERAVASWPQGWAGGNLRDILTASGIDVDVPWRELPRETQEWILYTEEHPSVMAYRGALSLKELEEAKASGQKPAYEGTFTGARRYLLDTFASTGSEKTKKRVAQFITPSPCPVCEGKRLRLEALRVTVAGRDIAELSALPLEQVREIVRELAGTVPAARPDDAAGEAPASSSRSAGQMIARDLAQRLTPMIELGLGYLSLDRSAPTLSGGELQRLRLATQLASALFGVVYVLDEPSAGLHPRDLDALVRLLHELKAQGNSVFVVEHSLPVIREADWLVDIGPRAGEHGGRVLYSGEPAGLREVEESATRGYLFPDPDAPRPAREPRRPQGWLELTGVQRNTVRDLDVSFPRGCLTAVTGVSGAGKSSLVSQALPALVRDRVGQPAGGARDDPEDTEAEELVLTGDRGSVRGRVAGGLEGIRRVVVIDQRPIGRTPRSNIATYTGLFDDMRKLFARTPEAKARKYPASRFSFNVASGRCPTCEGEGAVMVELLFLPSVYTPCPDCGGSRYQGSTLEVTWNGLSIADVLELTVERAREVFRDEAPIHRALSVLDDVGLGYLRLGQPAPELSGGEAQRVKLAAELQRTDRGDALCILDEPTAGLHPSDADRLLRVLQDLVEAGSTVVMAELDPRMVAQADHVIELGPGAGCDGGRVVASGTPAEVAAAQDSPTAPYLRAALG